MNRTTTGAIQSVHAVTLGSPLNAAALIGATSLTVVDTTDFDSEAGGSLTVGGTVYTYSAVDDDAGVITLSGGGLAAAAADGDRVDVWNVAQNASAVEYRALVKLPGDVDNADSLEAAISLPLVTLLPQGLREEGGGESVTLEERDDEWVVTDARGIAPQIQMASFPTTITNWNAATAPGEYLSIEGLSTNSPDDFYSWAGTVHGRGTPGTFPNLGAGVVQVLHRVDAGAIVNSAPPQTWIRYVNGTGVWQDWWMADGAGADHNAGVFTAGAGVTIDSQYGRIEAGWAIVYCQYHVAAGAGTPITVPTDGDIGNLTVLNIAAVFQTVMGFPTWGLPSAGVGRTATHIVSGNTIKLASVAGSANIVSGDSFSFSGKYPLV